MIAVRLDGKAARRPFYQARARSRAFARGDRNSELAE